MPNLPVYLYDEIAEIKDLTSLNQLTEKYAGIYQHSFKEVTLASANPLTFFNFKSPDLLKECRQLLLARRKALAENTPLNGLRIEHELISVHDLKKNFRVKVK